ncbi:fungal trichothecene efflux pump [Exophiala viscosa]|uniref:Fungal trichothecene efflux pump n=1 Tax=Exophiala viscosa TaxID=2486360 RepID=A0AAN6IE44_9EURO|nr:fungal trichothecene efflux pump [Exophiala viscosa]
MAIEIIDSKAAEPGVATAHEEKIDVNHREDSVGNDSLHAYETRSIDLRTVMGILALAVTYEACLFSFALPAAILLTINEEIGPSSNIAWAATSWSLASAVVMTIAGRCSDIFGRRNFFVTGNLLGIVGCAVACRATNTSMIILGSSFLGLATGCQQLGFAAANEIVPKKNRGQTIAFMSLVSLPGSSFGAPIAYHLVAQGSWRWTYYASLILNVVALILILVFYWPPDFLGLHPQGKTQRQQFLELDFVGLLLFGGGLTVFLVGIGFGGNPYPWTSAVVLAPTIIGGLSVFVAFPLWEVFSPSTIAKLCPPRLMSNVRAVVVPLGVSFTGGMALTSTIVLWPQQIQRLFTTVPRTVGWYGLATNAAATAGLMLAGQTFATIRKTRYQYISVVVMMTVFLGTIATVDQHTPVRGIVLVSLASAMIGATNCMSILIVQLGARDEDIGLATGLVNSVRSAGGAVGVAIFSSLLADRVTSTWARDIGRTLLQAGLPATSLAAFLAALPLGNFGSVPGATSAIIKLALEAQKSVYVNAFRLIYCVTVAFGGLAIIGALFVANVDDKLTNQVNVQLDQPHLVGRGKGEAMVLATVSRSSRP